MHYLIIFIFIVILCEIAFSLIYKKIYGTKYKFIKKIPIKKFVIETHPYLPFVLKKNFKLSKSEKIEYPFHKDFYTQLHSALVPIQTYGNQDLKFYLQN